MQTFSEKNKFFFHFKHYQIYFIFKKSKQLNIIFFFVYFATTYFVRQKKQRRKIAWSTFHLLHILSYMYYCDATSAARASAILVGGK